jgi:hypothetical protein
MTRNRTTATAGCTGVTRVAGAIMLVFTLATAACGREAKEAAMAPEATVTAAEWQALGGLRVVFGHQSVGRNILDGLQKLAAQGPAPLAVTESRTPTGAAGITHFAVGANGDPLAKIRDFAAVIDGAGADVADVALVKLCYIDFSGSADPEQVAAAYCDTLEALAHRHPRTRFVAVTVPLTTVQTGPKAVVKRLLGRIPDGYAENARRQVFNDVLRTRDGGRHLFDLAALEAEPNRRRHENHDIQCLDPALTSDGGHLNDAGARRVAAQLVHFLAGLAAPVKEP